MAHLKRFRITQNQLPSAHAVSYSSFKEYHYQQEIKAHNGFKYSYFTVGQEDVFSYRTGPRTPFCIGRMLSVSALHTLKRTWGGAAGIIITMSLDYRTQRVRILLEEGRPY